MKASDDDDVSIDNEENTDWVKDFEESRMINKLMKWLLILCSHRRSICNDDNN